MTANFFDDFTWEKILSLYPAREYSVSDYHKILSPEFPDFLEKYLELPLLTRLKGIGLLCGTDWTMLYKNRFYSTNGFNTPTLGSKKNVQMIIPKYIRKSLGIKNSVGEGIKPDKIATLSEPTYPDPWGGVVDYSRFDHSVGVALIVWHFTRDKKQTIAGLLHDVSTPLFSHVADFRKGDALTQSATEEANATLIKNDELLLELLKFDDLTPDDVSDYHKYPVADNEIPCLSADRLEYMYPSGMALEGSWTLDEIRQTYNDIAILKNECGEDELGFRTLELAELYCYRFCMTGHLLQLNENKLTLQMLAKITSLAIDLGIITEEDCLRISEKEAMERFEMAAAHIGLQISTGREEFSRLYKTFRTMTRIEHTNSALPEDEYFSVSLKVKQRYINPLVKCGGSNGGCAKRLYDVSEKSRKLIDDFLKYEDTKFGCVKLVK